jgi:hypothetical protein
LCGGRDKSIKRRMEMIKGTRVLVTGESWQGEVGEFMGVEETPIGKLGKILLDNGMSTLVARDEVKELPKPKLIGTEVTLSKEDQELSIRIGTARYEYDRAHGCIPTIYGKSDRTDKEREWDSYGAEVAYCRLFGVEPDKSTGARSPIDATQKSGETVDVKQNPSKYGDLVVKIKDRKILPTKYAVMQGIFPTYIFNGHKSSRETIKRERISQIFKPAAYYVPKWELEE